jgi:hypothetical protein
MAYVTRKSNMRSNSWMDATTPSEDLVQTQRAWTATYQELAATTGHNTALRRQLLQLSTRILRLRQRGGSSDRTGMRAA